jgi:hypothetical protein
MAKKAAAVRTRSTASQTEIRDDVEVVPTIVAVVDTTLMVVDTTTTVLTLFVMKVSLSVPDRSFLGVEKGRIRSNWVIFPMVKDGRRKVTDG